MEHPNDSNDDSDFDGPEEAWMDPTRAEESTKAQVVDAVPCFDNELKPLPELNGEAPPRGKGPSRGYLIRYTRIAHLHILGYTSNQIAKHLGYSAPGISLALKHPFTQSEITRLRDEMFSIDTASILKDVGPDAARNLASIVRDRDHKHNFAASQMIVEKVTGKARQEINVESGTLSTFMDLLKEMNSGNEQVNANSALPATIDVTPQKEAKEPDYMDSLIESLKHP